MNRTDLWVLRLTLSAVLYGVVMHLSTCDLGRYVLVN
jgi:hypothetical protein